MNESTESPAKGDNRIMSSEELRVYIQEIESMRKHEDGLISERTRIFLIASALIGASIGWNVLSAYALIMSSLGFFVSVFWCMLAARHMVLMHWYRTRVENGCPDPKYYVHDESAPIITRIHKERIQLRKKEYKVSFLSWMASILKSLLQVKLSGTEIMCGLLPLTFFLFWILCLGYLLTQVGPSVIAPIVDTLHKEFGTKYWLSAFAIDRQATIHYLG